MDDVYTQEGFAVSHLPDMDYYQVQSGSFLTSAIGPLPQKSLYDQAASAVSGFFNDLTKGIGQGAANLTSPLVNQVIFILIIVIVGIFVLGKSKMLKLNL